VPPWKRTRQETQPAACLLAKPTQLNINLSSDRFAMFNKQRDITSLVRGGPFRSWPISAPSQQIYWRGPHSGNIVHEVTTRDKGITEMLIY
jgi:hypothetical protein